MGNYNNEAFDAFFAKLNGKVYTHPDQMRTDFIDALNEHKLVVKKKLTFGLSKKKAEKKTTPAPIEAPKKKPVKKTTTKVTTKKPVKKKK